MIVVSELLIVNERKGKELHPYSTGVTQKPAARMSRDGRSLNGVERDAVHQYFP